jgi:L-gulonate 5-dehydrogenase
MRAAKLTENQKIVLRDIPRPEPGEGQVLVQIRAAGICGTDLHIYAGHRPDIRLPRVMGHEFAGVVAALGAGVGGLVEGDHVTIDPVVACGQCYACRRGRRNLCTSIMCLGCQTEGGFQDFVVVKSGDVHKIKPTIPFEHAAMCEPFAIAAQVSERSEVRAGDRVAVFGAGTIGLCILQVFQLVGAKVLITDIIDSRLDKAKELGADATVNPSEEELAQAAESFAGEEGVDIVVEAVGNPALIDTALGIVTRGGRIVVLGMDKAATRLSEFNFVRTELDIRGSVLNNKKFPRVVEWLEQGKINPAAMITAKYPIERIEEAFAAVTANPREFLKVVVTF